MHTSRWSVREQAEGREWGFDSFFENSYASETSSDCSFLTVVFSALGRTAQRARVSPRGGGSGLEATH